MSTKARIRKLLLDHRRPDTEVDEQRLNLLLDAGNPDSEVDWEEVQEALGYSSLQAQAFLNSVNAEFGKNLTPESVMNAKGSGGFLSLLD